MHFVHSLGRKVLASLIIACVIETVLAVGVTAISHPFDAQFAQAWWLAFSRSLPAGVLVGLFMTFFLKPRMDRMRRAAAWMAQALSAACRWQFSRWSFTMPEACMKA